MKKLIFVFLLVASIATPLAALDFSAGGDFTFAPTWVTIYNTDLKIKTSDNLLGLNGFFDAQYVRAGLGLNFNVGGTKYKADMTTPIGKVSRSETKNTSLVNLRLSVLGKYPFTIANIVKLYPLAGFEFDFNLSAKENGKDMKKDLKNEEKQDFNHYYFVLGAGADITVMENLFVTPKATFGFDMRKNSLTKDLEAKGGHQIKIEFGVGVGYKF